MLERCKKLLNMRQSYWRDVKLREAQQLIVQCSGLFMEATTTGQFAVQTDSVKVNFSFNNRLGADVSLEKVIIRGFDTIVAKPLDKNKNLNFSKTVYVSADVPITQPYWLEHKMEEGYFNVKDQQKIGRPDVEPSILMTVQLKVSGEYHNFRIPLQYKFTDPVKGEIYWPVVVMPSFTMKVSPDLILWQKSKEPEEFIARYEKLYTSYKLNNTIKISRAVRDPSLGEIRGYQSLDSFELSKGVKSIAGESIIHIDLPPVSDNGTFIRVIMPNEKTEFLTMDTRRPV